MVAAQDEISELALTTKPFSKCINQHKKVCYSSFSLLPLAKMIGEKLGD